MTALSGRRAGSADIAFFAALLATALALGPALAHLLELPNKITLSRDAYLTVQSIYAGWNRLALVLGVEVIALAAAAWLSRGTPDVARLALLALGLVIAAQAVFWTFTYPANVATEQWTRLPYDWEAVRRRWEYSHAAGAACQLLAMAAISAAAVRRARVTPESR